MYSKHKFTYWLFSFFMIISTFSVNAYEIANVPIAETIRIAKNTPPLRLQGAGIRTKFLFDIYVGAFYAEHAVHSPAEAILTAGSKRMWFRFLYKKIEAAEFQQAWREGIEANNEASIIQKNKKAIEHFIHFFNQDIVKKDVITIDYLPKQGTRVTINKVVKDIIPGDEFYTLLLNTWMGENPPSQKFQDALLSYP